MIHHMMRTFLAAISLISITARAETPADIRKLPEQKTTYKAVPTYGGGAIQHVAISPANPDLILAGVDVAGIFRSNDGGTTWEPSWDGLRIDADFATADVMFDPTVPNRAWLAAGKTWLSGHKLAGRGGLFRSDDQGKTWQLVNKSLHFIGQYGTGGRQYGDILWRDPNTADRLLIGTIDQGLLESTNGGKTVRPIIAADDIGSIGSMKVQPGHPEIIYVASRDYGSKFRPDCPTGLWQSNDAGKTFRRVIENSPLWSVAANSDGSVLASGNTIHFRKPASEIWTKIDTSKTVDAQRFIVASDPHTSGRYIVLSVCKSGNAFSHPKLYEFTTSRPELIAMYNDVNKIYTPVSTDSSDGWYAFRHWFAAGAGNIVFHPQRPGTVFLADWYTVNRSLDGGKTWRSHPDGLLTLVPTHAAYSLKYPGKVYLGFADVGLYEATITEQEMKARSSRKQVPRPHTRPYVFNINGREVVLIDGYEYSGFSSLHRREDNGEWKTVFQYQPESTSYATSTMACDTASQTIVYLTVRRDLFISKDAGMSWSPYIPEIPSVQTISYNAPWWIADTSKGTFRTQDLQGTWEQVGHWPAKMAKDITTPERWYGLDKKRGLVRSVNQAQSFEPILAGAQQWTQGADGTLYAWASSLSLDAYWIASSTDGGNTWRRLSTPPGYPQGSSLTPDPHHPKQFLFGSHGICFWLAKEE